MKFARIALLIVCSGLAVHFRIPQLIVPELPHLQLKAPSANWRMILRQARQRTLQQTHAIIKASAQRHKVPAAFVKSIVAAESNFDCGAISSKGAIGLMQLMPETAQEYGASDPSIPEQNIDAGTRYLRVLMDRYRKYRNCMTRVIAAYNAGPAVVDRYRGVPPYRETRGYVARVMNYFHHFQKERG